jgi:hypothetical protein
MTICTLIIISGDLFPLNVPADLVGGNAVLPQSCLYIAAARSFYGNLCCGMTSFDMRQVFCGMFLRNLFVPHRLSWLSKGSHDAVAIQEHAEFLAAHQPELFDDFTYAFPHEYPDTPIVLAQNENYQDNPRFPSVYKWWIAKECMVCIQPDKENTEPPLHFFSECVQRTGWGDNRKFMFTIGQLERPTLQDWTNAREDPARMTLPRYAINHPWILRFTPDIHGNGSYYHYVVAKVGGGRHFVPLVSRAISLVVDGKEKTIIFDKNLVTEGCTKEAVMDSATIKDDTIMSIMFKPKQQHYLGRVKFYVPPPKSTPGKYIAPKLGHSREELMFSFELRVFEMAVIEDEASGIPRATWEKAKQKPNQHVRVPPGDPGADIINEDLVNKTEESIAYFHDWTCAVDSLCSSLHGIRGFEKCIRKLQEDRIKLGLESDFTKLTNTVQKNSDYTLRKKPFYLSAVGGPDLPVLCTIADHGTNHAFCVRGKKLYDSSIAKVLYLGEGTLQKYQKNTMGKCYYVNKK